MRISLALCALAALTAQDLTQKANASSLPVPVSQSEDSDSLDSSPSNAETVAAIAAPEMTTAQIESSSPTIANTEPAKLPEIPAPEFSPPPQKKIDSSLPLETVAPFKALTANAEATSSNASNQEQLAEKPVVTPPVVISDNALEQTTRTATSAPSVSPVAPRVTFDNVIEIERSRLPQEIQKHIGIGSTLVGSDLGLTKNTPITDQGLPLTQWADQVRQCNQEKPQLFIVREETKNEKGIPTLRVAPVLFDGQPGKIVRNANGQLVCPSQNAATAAPAAPTPSSEQATKPPVRSSTPQDISEMYDRASKAVVFIRNNASLDNKGNFDIGSGFMVRQRDGQIVIVTNAHVVANLAQGERFNVRVPNDKPRPALDIFQHDDTVNPEDGNPLTVEVVGFDSRGEDLAVLRVIQPSPTLQPLPLASVNPIKIGDPVYVIGTPLGLYQDVLTEGIVSRIDRERGRVLTNADVSSGNSGGPLLNRQGEVVGVVTARSSLNEKTLSSSGISVAINLDRLQAFLEQEKSPVAQSRAVRTSIEGEKTSLSLNGVVLERQISSTDRQISVDSSYYDAYFFDAQAGQQVVIQMQSQEIQPYLYLLGPDGPVKRLIKESDSENGIATVNAILPGDGRYFVIANTRLRGQQGDYQISARIIQ